MDPFSSYSILVQRPREDVRNKSGVSARTSRRCYEENGRVEFKRYNASTRAANKLTTWKEHV